MDSGNVMKQGTPGIFSHANLGLLCPSNRLFTDADGDGYVERFHLVLGIAPGMNYGLIWAGLINLAVRLNMECSGSEVAAPVCARNPKAGMLLVYPPNALHKQAACLELVGVESWTLSGHNPEAMGRLLTCLATETILAYDICMKSLAIAEAGATDCSICWNGDLADSLVKLPNRPKKERVEGNGPQSSIDLVSISSAIFVGSENDPRGRRLTLGLELPLQLSPVCAREAFLLMGTAAARNQSVSKALIPFTGVSLGGNFFHTVGSLLSKFITTDLAADVAPAMENENGYSKCKRDIAAGDRG